MKVRERLGLSVSVKTEPNADSDVITRLEPYDIINVLELEGSPMSFQDTGHLGDSNYAWYRLADHENNPTDGWVNAEHPPDGKRFDIFEGNGIEPKPQIIKAVLNIHDENGTVSTYELIPLEE